MLRLGRWRRTKGGRRTKSRCHLRRRAKGRLPKHGRRRRLCWLTEHAAMLLLLRWLRRLAKHTSGCWLLLLLSQHSAGRSPKHAAAAAAARAACGFAENGGPRGLRCSRAKPAAAAGARRWCDCTERSGAPVLRARRAEALNVRVGGLPELVRPRWLAVALDVLRRTQAGGKRGHGAAAHVSGGRTAGEPSKLHWRCMVAASCAAAASGSGGLVTAAAHSPSLPSPTPLPGVVAW